MDFQRLFKRKEDYPARPSAKVDPRESFNTREVLLCEGELLEGTTPACLVWSGVGGSIRVKAEKILGILEGRTRIKVADISDLYPALFEKAPNPGAEFNIPLQAVVSQLEDLFNGLSPEGTVPDEFDTPFGQLAREDEARLTEKKVDRLLAPEAKAPRFFTLPPSGARPAPNQPDQSSNLAKPEAATATRESPSNGADRNAQNPVSPAEQSDLWSANLDSASELQPACSAEPAGSPSTPRLPNPKIRRHGQASLQELYLTDETLDGVKVAEMILQLPRVSDAVILLSDGAALGGRLTGGLTEPLLSRTPDFVKHLLDFTKSIQGGPVKFVTFSGHACQVSLTIDKDILIVTGHEGKYLPPGLRERLVATAEALNMIYGLQS